MKDTFTEDLKNAFKEDILEKKYYDIFLDFYICYVNAIKKEVREKNLHIKLFKTFISLLKEQKKNPYKFPNYHKKIEKPFNYYMFGIDFIKPLVDMEHSALLGEENLKKIEKTVNEKKNVILLSNHQSESDPQALSILLEKKFSSLAKKIIYVAGERVIKDPLAIPFSMGCDLLCIYSKKYINTPKELRRDKQIHNNKTMHLMSSLLKEGGKIIYVAPSGGRDRKNENGIIEVAPFDPQSLEMFYLMAKKSRKYTHFYPLSLRTYDLLPPPDTIQIEMGERRTTKRVSIAAYFGKEIDMQSFTGEDRLSTRKIRAKKIHEIVENGYNILKEIK